MQVEEETARLAWARALHREVSSGLSGVLLQLATLPVAPAARRARAMLENATATIEACVRAAREVELALRPPLLEEAGLGPPFHWLAERAPTASPIVVQQPARLPRLGVAREGLLFGAVALLLERGLRGRRALTVRLTDAALVIELGGTPAREHAYAVATARERLRGQALVTLRRRPGTAVVVRVSRAARPGAVVSGPRT